MFVKETEVFMPLSEADWNSIEKIDNKLNIFKKKRNTKEYDYAQGKGFVSMKEREAMLDTLLYFYKKLRA